MTGMVVAAGALLPVSIASAQDAPDGRHHEHHGGQARPEGNRPAPQPAAPRSGPQPAAPRVNAGAQQGGFRAQTGDGGNARFQARAQAGFGDGHRDDGNGRFPAAANQGSYRGQFQNGGDPRVSGRDGYRGGRPDSGGDPRFATGGQGAYRAQPDRPAYQPAPGRPYDAPSVNQGYRQQQVQRGYRPQPGGPGFNPGAPRWSNPGGGNWTRGWRDDRRYDWNRYRAENRFVFNLPRYYAPRGFGYGYRRFEIGVTLGAPFFAEDYWIDDPYDYRLPPAYGPYRWVRYYNDALLIDLRSGYVVDAVYGIFW